MRLNSDILQDALSEHYTLTYFGPEADRLHLRRPEIYDIYHKELPFSENRTYCISTELLPEEPVGREGVLLICVGLELTQRYQQGDICCIWIQDQPSRVIEVFNTVQRIFDLYDDWESNLQTILYTTAGIQDMVDCCYDILRNPIIVIDASLRFLGYSTCISKDAALENYRPGLDGKVQMRHLKTYLEFRDNYTKSGPQFYNEESVFLWDVWHNGRYLGNVTIPYVYTKQRKSDRWILSVLEQYIVQALTQQKNNPELHTNVLRNALRNLLTNNSLSEESIHALNSYTGVSQCVRIRFRTHNKHSLPIHYYCSYIENAFPLSVCFELDSSMVLFADISKPGAEQSVRNVLSSLSRQLDFSAGISNPFHNLAHARAYDQQARVALKKAMAFQKPATAYFRDQMLTYLLEHATADMPLESFYSEGIQRILDHDATAKVSFAHTLLLYLRNATNITQTALELRIHRSSFLERLRNIESLLDVSLDDPEARLYLQIILERIERQPGVPQHS